jgi:hypothetical protein
MWIIVAPEQARLQHGDTHYKCPRNQLLIRRRRYAQENQNRAIEAHPVLISKVPNLCPDFRLRHSRDLIYHQSASGTETVSRVRLNHEAKQWRLRWVRGERADRNGFCAIESIILNDYRWTRFTGIVVTSRNSPNLAALHLSSQSEIESIKS